MAQSRLVRPRHGRIVAGVLAGIAHRFGWSPWLVRLLFLVSLVFPGPQILAYFVLWLLIPPSDRGRPPPSR